jgi:hypothetical protein
METTSAIARTYGRISDRQLSPELGAVVASVLPITLPAADGASPARSCGFMSAAAILLVLSWCTFEQPWELAYAQTGVERAAIISSKGLLLALGILTLRRSPLARVLFLFLFVCAASELAIVPMLPTQYAVDSNGFLLSVIECLAKGMAFFAVARTALAPRR